MRSNLVTDHFIGRRTALGLIGAASAAAVSPATAIPAAAGPHPMAALAPADQLRAFGKIWSGYDAPVIGAYHGTMYLRMNDKPSIPLFGYAGTGVSQARIDEKGDLVLKSRETALFTDLATGEVLESWRNPFTGETVEVYHFYDDLLLGHIGADAAPSMLGFQTLGEDQVMMSWDYANAYDNPVTPQGWPSYSTGPRISTSEHFLYYFSRAALLDRDTPSIRVQGSFARMSQCWPFMKMGKSPLKDSMLFGRMFTHKGLAGYGDVPPKLLAYLEKHAPRYLEVPQGWGAASETDVRRLDTWKAFASDIPPQTPGTAWQQQPMAPGLAPPTGLGARYRR